MKKFKAFIALDANNNKNNIEVVNKLYKLVYGFKVGYRSFYNKDADKLIGEIKRKKSKLFLDLKLHDIPNTVKKGLDAIHKIKPVFTTIHISGGDYMMQTCSTKNKFTKICVVEDIADQWSIENSNIFQGYFHILGGTISSVGNKKEDLLINSLIDRVKKDKIDEIILATSATVEGQTTAFYIQDSLKDIDVKITKLAQGLPVGGEIESLDDGTLLSAFKNRSKINSNSS